MADNITLPGTAQVVRTVEIAGIDYQVLVLADNLGNLIPSFLLTNGRGLGTVVLNDVAVKGMAAHGGTTPTNPVPIAANVTTSLSALTPLANNLLTQLMATGDGRLIAVPWCAPEDQLATNPVALTTTSDVQLYAAQPAGVRIALIGLLVSNSSATDTEIIIKDGTTEIGRVNASLSNRSSQPGSFPLPMKGTAATVMNVALSIAATTVRVTPFAYRTRL